MAAAAKPEDAKTEMEETVTEEDAKEEVVEAAVAKEDLKPEVKLSWGDYEPDPEESTPVAAAAAAATAPSDASGGAADAASETSMNIQSLSIASQDEEIREGGHLLEDPEESQIESVTGETVYTSAVKFEDLPLSDDLIKGLYVEMNFKRPSRIQAVTLPMILSPPHKDLVAQAHNGSGKTTCFVLGMLSRVDPRMPGPQAMCICPTRELAHQNRDVLLKMGKYTGITSFCAVSTDSASFVPVNNRPEVTEHVVIGTPGTILKLMQKSKLKTGSIKILVFDEADHMLAEGGFRDDSERIMKTIRRSNTNCQVLLFSATFNEVVKAFVTRVIRDGNQIFVRKEELTLDKVKQYKVQCASESTKIAVVKVILEYGQKVGQTIIFVRTRNAAKSLHESLSSEGYECTSIQGALNNEDRDKIIKEFKEGYTHVLITTDLLARGFDQSQVNLVVNFDLPVAYDPRRAAPPQPDCEVYLHRVGRAGRFGRKGAVFNLLMSREDRLIMEKLERHFQNFIPEVMNWRDGDEIETVLKDAGLL